MVQPTGNEQGEPKAGDAQRRIYPTQLERGAWIVPRSWTHLHAWVTIIFFVATFGPLFGGWATSTRLIAGIPITIGWILLWMVIQTVNLIGFYFTSIRPWIRNLPDDEAGRDEAANLPHETNR